MIVCLCDGSVSGIFTAIYKAWEIGTSKTRISVSAFEDMDLFSEYLNVETDEDLAYKVASSIRGKLSQDIYTYVYHAAVSFADDRGEAVYRFLIEAFKYGPDIINNLANPFVRRIFELNRRVWHEAHHYMGFLRFIKCSYRDTILMIGRYAPDSDVLSDISEHFCDRMRNENWVIADTRRRKCALHMAGDKSYVISTADTVPGFVFSDDLEDIDKINYSSLWSVFTSTIAIEARKNERLQKQLVPLKYRTYMTEFGGSAKS